jgi:para-nitrobenzyl esterase
MRKGEHVSTRRVAPQIRKEPRARRIPLSEPKCDTPEHACEPAFVDPSRSHVQHCLVQCFSRFGHIDAVDVEEDQRGTDCSSPPLRYLPSDRVRGASSMKRTRLVTAIAAVLALACGNDGDENRASHESTEVSQPDANGALPGEGGIQSGTLIELRDGRIQGDADRGTRRFRGIRYARAPEGDLRWKPPEPVEPWNEVIPALEYGSPCAQPSWIQGPESLTEDCLFLNVWTPDPAPASLRPVMVWLPGGGNQNGAASDKSPLVANEYIYDGRDLAVSGNAIVVTINYRVGVFGFFAHPNLTAEGSNPGNQGLLDQQAALRWVRDNIRAFGGDPENVTLFGESAGSQDTCLQVVSPGSRGLFHRAISQSGGCVTYRKTKDVAETQATAFEQGVGCDGADDPLACLRGKTVEELLIPAPIDGVADGGVDAPGGAQFNGGTPRWDFNPVVAGTVIPDQPRASIDADDFAKVPYILGANFEEGALFLLSATPVTTEAEYMSALERLFAGRAADVAAVYPSSSFATPQDALVRVWGDYRLLCSTYNSALRFAEHGAEVYTYGFARSIPGLEAIGPTHGTEMPYVFGTLPNPTAEDATLSDTMQGYWTRFAEFGNPNGESALEWPRFDAASDRSIRFDVVIEVLIGFRRQECDFWATVYDAQLP